MTMRSIFPLSLVLFFMVGAAPLQAQSYGECPSNDPTCQAKYALYDAYLTQMGVGVTLFNLPPLYQEILASQYPNANLAEVRFGFSNRQPPNNATADCDKIYFNNQSMVDALAAGTVSDGGSFHWLFHELRHFEQCREQGSREAFARLWWEHLSETELYMLITTGGWATVHDQMAMEQDADARADAVLAAMEACCIHPSDGTLMRPLQVTPMAFSSTFLLVDQGLTVEVQTSDGATPYAFEWSWRRPSSGAFQPVPSSPGAPNQVILALTEAGTYDLKVRVLQGGQSSTSSTPVPHEETRSFVVHGPEVTNLVLNPSTVDDGETAEATVYLSYLPPGQSVAVSLNSSNDVASVPSSITVTAGANGAAVATFDVTTAGPLLATQGSIIEARIGNSARTATLTIEADPPPTRAGFSIRAEKLDLRPDQPFELILVLDPPGVGPIDVLLESSDARSVGVPRRVRFAKGEREKRILLRTARSVPRATSVTLRARLGKDPRQVAETAVRVQPAPARRRR